MEYQDDYTAVYCNKSIIKYYNDGIKKYIMGIDLAFDYEQEKRDNISKERKRKIALILEDLG